MTVDAPDHAVPAVPTGARADVLTADPGRRLLVAEVWLVLALSLGRSGVFALVDLIASATAPGRLADQAAVLNGSRAPGQPWIDLVLQLLALGFGLTPVLLVCYLLARSGQGLRTVGLDRGQPARDLTRGLALAAAVGGAGLAFYLVTHALGLDLTVVPESLPHVWWRYPVLVLSALQNSLLEEFVVVGYLLLRLQQLGVGPRTAIGLSALLRGSYHLYQGLGGFVGNLVMGVVFAWMYRRWGRLGPLVVAHTVMDLFAFVGYALLVGHVGWLPRP
jgi:membrane protease YdiL (CAAX protease family)